MLLEKIDRLLAGLSFSDKCFAFFAVTLLGAGVALIVGLKFMAQEMANFGFLFLVVAIGAALARVWQGRKNNASLY